MGIMIVSSQNNSIFFCLNIYISNRIPRKTPTNPEHITQNTFAKCEGNSNEYSELFVVVVSNSLYL